MGKITNVLSKIQESRQQHQDQKTSDLLHVKDYLQAYSKKVVMVIVAIVVTIIVAGTIVAVFMSGKIYNLEKSIKMQDKKFNNLTIFLSNTKSLSDNQIQDFNFRLNNEAESRKIQINKLALIDDVYYTNLIKSIHANTFQINYLEKKLAPGTQVKDLSYPPSGN